MVNTSYNEGRQPYGIPRRITCHVGQIGRSVADAPTPQQRGRGHPKVYPDRLFLKALVIMIVRHLHHVHELRSRLAQPTAEMASLRVLLTEKAVFPRVGRGNDA